MSTIYDNDVIGDYDLYGMNYASRNLITRNFYKSPDWRRIKKEFWSKQPIRECNGCGSTEDLQVDHIKPIKSAWSLRLDINNLQILCSDCNKKKCNDSNELFMQDLRYSLDEKRVRQNRIRDQIDRLDYIYNFDNSKKDLIKDLYISYTYFCEDKQKTEIPREDWIRTFVKANGLKQKRNSNLEIFFEKMHKIHQEEA